MKFTVWALAGIVLAGLFYAPVPASGQNKDILAVQQGRAALPRASS